jgi:hypothetical protein
MFFAMESRLKLRALLARNKIEQFAKRVPMTEQDLEEQIEKRKGKEEIIDKWKGLLSTPLYSPPTL